MIGIEFRLLLAAVLAGGFFAFRGWWLESVVAGVFAIVCAAMIALQPPAE